MYRDLVLSHSEGRFANRHERWEGDAVDAAALGVRWVAGRIALRERSQARKTTTLFLLPSLKLRRDKPRRGLWQRRESADGEVVWS